MLLKLVPDKTNVRFMTIHRIALVISAIAVIASLVMVFTRGLNFGIDFAGGTVVEIDEPAGVTVEQIRTSLSDLDLGEVQVTEARTAGADSEPIVVIRVGQVDEEVPGADEAAEGEEAGGETAAPAAAGTVADRIISALSEDYGDITMRSRATVGPKVSGELLRAGVTALAVALGLMMVYITFRFEWHYGFGAVAALFHDVIITIGLFSLLQIDFNLTTIAALLTIIGYSMNDTVVVFDRVREERRRYKKLPLPKVIDIALNETLSRTTLTSGTTLLALLSIFLLGGEVLRGMSFALIWGILIGTYSSIFVASALLIVTGLDSHREKEDEGPDEGEPVTG